MNFDPVDFARFVSLNGVDSSSAQVEGKKGCLVGPMGKGRLQELMRAYIEVKCRKVV